MEPLARRVLFDDRQRAAFDEKRAKRVTVVGCVSEKRHRRRQRRDQAGGWPNIASLTWCQLEGDQPAFVVDDGVDFGGSAAATSTDCLFIRPPFPPALQRWALAVVLSMH